MSELIEAADIDCSRYPMEEVFQLLHKSIELRLPSVIFDLDTESDYNCQE